MYKRVDRTTKNGVWKITCVRSAMLDHLGGWLINTKTKARYVFNIIDGRRVRYMRQPEPAKIPRYVDELIYDLEQEVYNELNR